MTKSDRLLMVTLTVLLGMTAPAVADECSTPRLNSERIEQRFGSYGIELLTQTDVVRTASLYSLEDGEAVTRTFAVTRYADSIDTELAEVHERILGGGSIGATLVEAGWTVKRRHLWIGELPATTGIGNLMNVEASSRLGVHIFDLEVGRGGERLHYATITEIHHPDYLDQAGIEQLFGAVEGVSRERAASTLELALDNLPTVQSPLGD